MACKMLNGNVFINNRMFQVNSINRFESEVLKKVLLGAGIEFQVPVQI